MNSNTNDIPCRPAHNDIINSSDINKNVISSVNDDNSNKENRRSL